MSVASTNPPPNAEHPPSARSQSSGASLRSSGSSRPSRPERSSSAALGVPSSSAAASSVGRWYTSPATSTSGTAYHSGATPSHDRSSKYPRGRTSGNRVDRCAHQSAAVASPRASQYENGAATPPASGSRNAGASSAKRRYSSTGSPLVPRSPVRRGSSVAQTWRRKLLCPVGCPSYRGEFAKIATMNGASALSTVHVRPGESPPSTQT